MTFDMHDGNVLKIPLTENAGTSANWQENFMYQQSLSNADKGIYARCHLIEFAGWEALVMEKVEPVGVIGNPWPCSFPIPDWVDYIDCQQVGMTQDGQLVAYDYAG